MDAKMLQIPQVQVQVSHRLLPTYTALANLGPATATQVSKMTGRCRAFESKNLNELLSMGLVTKHHDGHAQVFKSKHYLLQTAFQRFYTVFSSMCDAILLTLDQGTIEFANEAFCKYFDLKESPAELKGLKTEEFIERITKSYLNLEEQTSRIREIINKGQEARDEEVAMKNGKIYLRELVPIIVDEKPFGWVWQHIDITERKKK